jgi:hypothetical protein
MTAGRNALQAALAENAAPRPFHVLLTLFHLLGADSFSCPNGIGGRKLDLAYPK